MNSVTKVAMIIIMQTDLVAALEFYKKLGLKLIFHVENRWAELSLGDLKIGLCPSTEPITYNRTGIVLEIGNLSEFYQKEAHTLNFLNQPTHASHGIIASIQDPSGNILDLYQPTPEKLKDLAKKLHGTEKNAQCCKTENSTQENADLCCKTKQNYQGCC